MAILSFIAGGMLAFVAAVSSWLFGGASGTTAINIYLIIGFGVPLTVIAFTTLRRTVAIVADASDEALTVKN